MSDSETYKALRKIERLLAMRLHSRKELLTKLLRSFSVDTVEKAYLLAKDEGLIVDDETIALQVVEELQRKSKGNLYIYGYLKKKGLPSVKLKNDEEFERAQHLLLKFSLKNDTLERQRLKEKISQKLKSRGFSQSSIRRIIYEEL